MSVPEFDLLLKDVRVVRPHGNTVHAADIAVRAGRIARVAPGIDVARAKEVCDGRGRLAFPGVVDAHMHSGIYSPLADDAVTESKAAAMGGVTSSLNYFRNAFNVGLLLLTCADAEQIEDGEALAFDARAGRVTRADGRTLVCDPIPGFLIDRVEAGGLLPQLKQRLKSTRNPP